MNEVGCRNSLNGISGFAPGRQAPDDHKGVKPLFPKQMRHTGAGRFAYSSAVKIDVFAVGKIFDFLRKVVGLQSNRSSNAI
jgi:hypothetical protein